MNNIFWLSCKSSSVHCSELVEWLWFIRTLSAYTHTHLVRALNQILWTLNATELFMIPEMLPTTTYLLMVELSNNTPHIHTIRQAVYRQSKKNKNKSTVEPKIIQFVLFCHGRFSSLLTVVDTVQLDIFQNHNNNEKCKASKAKKTVCRW